MKKPLDPIEQRRADILLLKVCGAVVGAVIVVGSIGSYLERRKLEAPMNELAGANPVDPIMNVDQNLESMLYGDPPASAGTYMDSREQELYNRDRSSMGFTDADRDFLREHGVSEEEARAAETIARQHGVE
jgi:hypothetical protein